MKLFCFSLIYERPPVVCAPWSYLKIQSSKDQRKEKISAEDISWSYWKTCPTCMLSCLNLNLWESIFCIFRKVCDTNTSVWKKWERNTKLKEMTAIFIVAIMENGFDTKQYSSRNGSLSRYQQCHKLLICMRSRIK